MFTVKENVSLFSWAQQKHAFRLFLYYLTLRGKHVCYVIPLTKLFLEHCQATRKELF